MGILNTESFDVVINFLLILVLFSKHLTKVHFKYIACFVIAIISLTGLYFFPAQGILVIVDLLLCLLFVFVLLEENWYEKIFSFLLVYILSSLIYQCFALVMDLLLNLPIFSGMNTVTEQATTKLLVIIALIGFLFIVRKIHYYFMLSFVDKIFLCCYSGVVCTILTLFHLDQADANYTVLHLFAILCIASAGILISYLTAPSRKNRDLKIIYSQNQYIKTLKAYYNEIKENALEIRKLRHDFRNHINVLKGLLDSDNMEQAKAYIQSIDNNITQRTTAIPNVGNALVNAVLLQKSLEFPEIKIVFKGTISETLHVDDYDLCTILNNLLDNALEYSSKNNFKPVHLYIYQEDAVLLLKLENYISAPVDTDAFNKTSKKDSQFHGLGLQNVRDTLEHYHGSLTYTQDSGKLSANVQLFLHSNTGK